MKKILLIILIILLAGCTTNKITYQKIGNDELYTIFKENENYTIIDVRSFEEYQSGHIENSINIPVDGISIDTLKDIDSDEVIIVYCRSGNRSKQAALKLIELGYTNVYDYGSINNYDCEIVK